MGKATKTLAIFDLDNTLFDALHKWGECLRTLAGDFAKHHSIPVETVHGLVREAHGQHRFNDGVALVDAMIEADPALQSSKQEMRIFIQEKWMDQSKGLTVLYNGVANALAELKGKGVSTVLQTDCEQVAVIRNLWLLGENAVKAGEVSSPSGVLGFFDRLYCQPGIAASSGYLKDVPELFQKQARGKLRVWDDRLQKPSADHISTILFETGVEAENAVYIGDSHKDGAEAMALTPKIDFAWAAYGTRVEDWILDLYARVGSKSFAYGRKAVEQAMAERGIEPDTVLDRSLEDILGAYSWGKGECSVGSRDFQHMEGPFARA